jgi:hypothetical protein
MCMKVEKFSSHLFFECDFSIQVILLVLKDLNFSFRWAQQSLDTNLKNWLVDHILNQFRSPIMHFCELDLVGSQLCHISR